MSLKQQPIVHIGEHADLAVLRDDKADGAVPGAVGLAGMNPSTWQRKPGALQLYGNEGKSDNS